MRQWSGQIVKDDVANIFYKRPSSGPKSCFNSKRTERRLCIHVLNEVSMMNLSERGKLKGNRS